LVDIGDDLNVEEKRASANEETTEDDLLASIDEEFDEATLAKLLSEETTEYSGADKEHDRVPDFNNSDILADLLNEQVPEEDDLHSNPYKPKDKNAIEITDIDQLDSVEFDELLAEIAEETADIDINSPDELLEELDIGDDLITAESTSEEATENFVDVDNLIAESMDNELTTEPYESKQVDVGLDEYPEFTKDVNLIDVDQENSSGLAQKLDLAKVYIEMDDIENAEVILREVAAKGNQKQQAEAQTLLDKLNSA
jgi:pilus assembly protein FimV